MDLFIKNLPPAATSRQIEMQFSGPLASEPYYIKHFHAEKLGDRPLAKITILDVAAGRAFLRDYGHQRGARPAKRMYWGATLNISESNVPPSDLALLSLAESSRRVAPITEQIAQRNATRATTRCFSGGQLECGVWGYDNRHPTFVSRFNDYRNGTITIGQKQAIMMLGNVSPDAEKCRIDINYHDCQDIVLDDEYLIFNLSFAPKIYLLEGTDQLSIVHLMQGMTIGQQPSQPPKKIRLAAIDTRHEKVTGTSWTYRFRLPSRADRSAVLSLLKNGKCKCPIQPLRTRSTLPPTRSFEDEFLRLQHELTMADRFGSKPFQLRFQMDRLARNGFLTPQKVIALLPKVTGLYTEFGLHPVVSALRRLARDTPFAGPLTDPSIFTLVELENYLATQCEHYDKSAPQDPYVLAKRYAHVNLIHKLVVTPSGYRLEGPEPEPTNRVLRRHASNTDSFIRVEFRDDDGAPVRYEARTDQSRIYHQRFKRVLDSPVLVCGLAFSFLGFSHSSLRGQSCWFMHGFVSRDGTLQYAERILKELGDFEKIRTPAKCAARIGQNFTDTNASIEIDPSQVKELPLVVRNGHDFGDGVGTISFELLEKIWRVYGTKRLLKPNVLQIRFQGAKGMVALDSTLKGEQLCLRSNMLKFITLSTWNLEICGAGFKPLPMVLNRQFIKLFEDLGIPTQAFMNLQNRFKDKLTNMTLSAVNTAAFLEETESPRATRLPSLIRYLGHVGVDYHSDTFLYSVVEMSVVSKLREVKYKGRIPVEEGVTLYGIMDETGILQEREIYVVTEKAPNGGKRVLVQKNVVVTRSPAMHPGDIQVVDAVDVPADSPLKHLSNVVVFSKWGQRDIPSMLSGGDLDGDLYNVIWDRQLVPRIVYQAAEYPRVVPKVLDRVVTRKDMSDFFVTFMETDQLGMICTAHLITADQKENGTLNPDCLKLCGMASTAVDFSKTGIPMTERVPPYPPRLRPDFMAPSPRVLVSKEGFLDFEDTPEEDDDAFEGIDTERRPMRYYTSQKALGHLFRNIDERQFVAKMQQRQRGATNRSLPNGSPTLMESLLKYAKHWALEYGALYEHQKALARDIRQSYDESLVTLLHDYEPTPHSPLSETEAFAGQIVGRQGGPQDKSLKDLAKTMRERFNTLVEHAVMRITKGDEAMQEADDLDDLYDETHYDEREFEALPRALACLEVSVTEGGYKDRQLGELKSFGYVALGVVLRELDRYRITTFGSRSGLPRA